MTLHLKRIYDQPSEDDGYRVLIDRLWPRGVSKQEAALDGWLKDIAPSPQLRTWFGHKPERFAEFKIRYMAELRDNPAVAELRRIARGHPTLTLLYGARDPHINHAVVLREYVKAR